jgi:small subunit ribosomal protein S7
MPRRNQATIRLLEPDSIYRSRIVQQVINKVMTDGKKSVAERITYDALALVGERTGNNPVEELEGAIKQLTPVLEVRSRRVGGGATYQVPVEVPARRARTLAVRWLVEFARARGEKTMAERLANEILDASKQQGNAWKRKDDIAFSTFCRPSAEAAAARVSQCSSSSMSINRPCDRLFPVSTASS